MGTVYSTDDRQTRGKERTIFLILPTWCRPHMVPYKEQVLGQSPALGRGGSDVRVGSLPQEWALRARVVRSSHLGAQPTEGDGSCLAEGEACALCACFYMGSETVMLHHIQK